MIVERAFAKINLTLDVLGKRSDGYHEVDMIMQTVDLSDLVWLENSESSHVALESNAASLPVDSRNLAFAAAEVFRRESGVQAGVRLRVEKNIPIAAGMGGGSADAAAVLRGMNRLFGTGYTLDELAQLGAQIGSDVPYCVYGGCAWARGRGERIELRLPRPASFFAVILRPNCHVSTGDVYANLMQGEYSTSLHAEAALRALRSNDVRALESAMFNGLELAAMRLHPEIAQMKEKMEHTLRAPVFMSGSGPTLFTLASTQGSAQRMYNALRGFAKEVYLCRFVR